VVERHNTYTVKAGETSPVGVNCLAGEHLTGGGVNPGPQSTFSHSIVAASYPNVNTFGDHIDNWTAVIRNTSTEDFTQVTVTALCASTPTSGSN
jgi:hypothetical protein